MPAGTVEAAKRQELSAAVYVVLAERGRPQTHRFGRAWMTGADGQMEAFVPERLPPTLFWRWFCDEVRKAAAASLLGEAYPDGVTRAEKERALPGRLGDEDSLPDRAGTGVAHGVVGTDASDPLESVLADERRRQAANWWQVAMGEATPRQRELLRALAELHEAAGDVPALAQAAAHTGMAASTARVQWKRLRDRLRRLGSCALVERSVTGAAGEG
jgi:hypothetical protein